MTLEKVDKVDHAGVAGRARVVVTPRGCTLYEEADRWLRSAASRQAAEKR